MTKIELLIKRIKVDNKMCDEINKIINEMDVRDEHCYPRAIGQIRSVMKIANRGEKNKYDIYDFSDAECDRLNSILDNTIAKKETVCRVSVQPS